MAMTDTEKADFVELLMSSGMSAKYAVELVEYKSEMADEIESFANTLKLGKQIPLAHIPNWENLNEKERRSLLWELGMDTENYSWKVDVQCWREKSANVCGKVVFCSERTDKEWITLVVDGRHVASDDARYFDCQEELYIMRTNATKK